VRMGKNEKKRTNEYEDSRQDTSNKNAWEQSDSEEKSLSQNNTNLQNFTDYRKQENDTYSYQSQKEEKCSLKCPRCKTPPPCKAFAVHSTTRSISLHKNFSKLMSQSEDDAALWRIIQSPQQKMEQC